MKIEVFYFRGCPNHSRAIEEIKQELAWARIQAAITEIEIADERQAELRSFYGSPTIRINGRDVASVPLNAATIGLQCRLYPGSEHPGVPSRDSLRNALREATHEEER